MTHRQLVALQIAIALAIFAAAASAQLVHQAEQITILTVEAKP